MTGTVPSELRILTDRLSLLDLVHDRQFDLDEFTFDETRREVRLHIGSYNWEGPCNDKLLRITDVLHVEIHDEPQIQMYSVFDVQITPPSIRIEANESLEIVLTVGEKCEIFILGLVLPDWMLDKQSKKEGPDSLFKRVIKWFYGV